MYGWYNARSGFLRRDNRDHLYPRWKEWSSHHPSHGYLGAPGAQRIVVEADAWQVLSRYASWCSIILYHGRVRPRFQERSVVLPGRRSHARGMGPTKTLAIRHGADALVRYVARVSHGVRYREQAQGPPSNEQRHKQGLHGPQGAGRRSGGAATAPARSARGRPGRSPTSERATRRLTAYREAPRPRCGSNLDNASATATKTVWGPLNGLPYCPLCGGDRDPSVGFSSVTLFNAVARQRREPLWG